MNEFNQEKFDIALKISLFIMILTLVVVIVFPPLILIFAVYLLARIIYKKIKNKTVKKLTFKEKIKDNLNKLINRI